MIQGPTQIAPISLSLVASRHTVQLTVCRLVSKVPFVESLDKSVLSSEPLIICGESAISYLNSYATGGILRHRLAGVKTASFHSEPHFASSSSGQLHEGPTLAPWLAAVLYCPLSR